MKRALLLTLLISTIASGSALAQSDLGLKGVGAAIGFVSPEDLDGTITLGVFADHGTIVPQLGLESHLDYWSTSEESFGSEFSVRDITLGARAKYYFEVSHPTLRPFAGAGLAFHLLHVEVDVPGFPEEDFDDSETKLGLDIGGGVAMPMNDRWNFSGELWYGMVEDFGQLSLRAAFLYKLGS